MSIVPAALLVMLGLESHKPLIYSLPVDLLRVQCVSDSHTAHQQALLGVSDVDRREQCWESILDILTFESFLLNIDQIFNLIIFYN